MNKEQVIEHVILDEGSIYTNNPNDIGGPTKYGITIPELSKFLDQSITADDISCLNLETAKSYYSWSYDKLKLEELPEILRYPFFDSVVNNGYGGASYFLQRALISLSQDIKADSDAGEKTRAAVKCVNPLILLNRFLDERRDYAKDAAKSKPDQKEFLQGWLNRIERLRVVKS